MVVKMLPLMVKGKEIPRGKKPEAKFVGVIYIYSSLRSRKCWECRSTGACTPRQYGGDGAR